MVSLNDSSILFLGLTHIGQIYSTSWLKKIGNCSVYDFNKLNLLKFKNKDFTEEEIFLKKLKLKRKFKYLKKDKDIEKFDIIFFTYDTNLNQLDGSPDLSYIKKYLKKLLALKLKENCYIIITSQVYPGFTDKIFKHLNPKQKINYIYMVDTLKMGNASKSFLKPEQLIFGGEKKNYFFLKKLFNKFKCKKYLFSVKEAELIKMAINLYLFFSVSYANLLDNFSRQNNVEFTKILGSLRNDKRIGKHSYIYPSLGISGGHLERDLFYLKQLNKSKIINKIIKQLFEFNNKRKNILNNEIDKLKIKNLKILIIGLSYKKNSYSITNSIFSNLINNPKYNLKIFDDTFSLNEIPKNKKIKNLDFAKNFNLFIYNYSNKKNKIVIEKILKNDHKKLLINISNKEKLIGKNIKNIFNYKTN